ncbi:putative F-box domain-containing protein [Medicago truncatula]|uniref:F-box SKIP23-like protein n=1 Tax=Medicago truncatula TaxID=3880 RepID=G7IWQ9_MEDTR|nr:F-box protein SKIP23 [Medicago truncatula]AES69472.1 F-box SKIP23-like protein [Medicago truncatula]RHN66261.1 putative F-box domain-containing protein [Medicago truncatula]
MAEVDWSDLPKELLNMISQRIDIEIDLIRFRSVCSNWRRSSSVSDHHLSLTINFPLLKSLSDSTITSFCCLSKRSIFLIKQQPPPQQQTLIRPWLVRITQNSSGKTKLNCPLTHISHLSSSTSFHLPRLIDFNKLSVLHLGTDFITDEFTSNSVLLPQKVISIGKHSLVLGILKNCTPQLMLFRCGNEPWEWIYDISTTSGDICVFKGQCYAVDKFGRTVMIGPDSTVQLVAEHVVHGGDRKLLVESDGELLLVDIYESLHFNIKVFRFHEKEKKWVNLMNLGDRVLFFGKGTSFSASASDLCVSKGNCIIFIDDAITNYWMQGGNGVYHLDQGRVSSVSHYHEYFNLFSPPPDWILKS